MKWDTMNSLIPITDALEKAHQHFNKVLFADALKTSPVITILPGGKRKALGWYGVERWENGESKPAELNIVAEELRRPASAILETLLHEMCHQFAHESIIKDCSRSGAYHNRKFKTIAESHGLICKPKDKRVGHGYTELGELGKTAVESILSTLEPHLVLVRMLPVGAKKKGKMLLWICCFCDTKIRSGRKDLNIQCNDCVNDFKLAGGDDDETEN